jgi:hypothetical protein
VVTLQGKTPSPRFGYRFEFIVVIGYRLLVIVAIIATFTSHYSGRCCAHQNLPLPVIVAKLLKFS